MSTGADRYLATTTINHHRRQQVALANDCRTMAQSMESLGEAVSQLNDRIKNEIFANYKSFMAHIATIQTLESVFASMLESLQLLMSIVEKLRTQLDQQHQKLRQKVLTLENLHRTSDYLRRLIDARRKSIEASSQES